MPPKLRYASLALSGAILSVPALTQPVQPAAQEAPIVITGKLPQSPDILVRTVYIGDLDLNSAAGQQAMENRVGKAVEDMCAIILPLPSYKGPMEKPCRDEAWASARPQMEAASHRASSGSIPLHSPPQ